MTRYNNYIKATTLTPRTAEVLYNIIDSNADTLDIAPAVPSKNLYIIGHAKN